MRLGFKKTALLILVALSLRLSLSDAFAIVRSPASQFLLPTHCQSPAAIMLMTRDPNVLDYFATGSASPTNRRRMFSDALVATFVLTNLSIRSPAPAIAATTTISPAQMFASWSATSGLNVLDPNDPSFVSFDPSAYAAMRDDPTRTPLFKRALKDRLQQSPRYRK